jgi:hypothetical protein
MSAGPKIKISNLKRNCAISQACSVYHTNILDNEDLAKTISCLANDKTVDKDILTLQSSILCNLYSVDGLNYDGKYCDFAYQVYEKFTRKYTKEKISKYITNFKRICEAYRNEILVVKNKTIYKRIDNDVFMEALSKVGIFFILMEFSRNYSSYGDKDRSSIVDKLNQKLYFDSKSKEFNFRSVKVDVKTEHKYLPPFYDKKYKYGCNCLCDSIFMITFFRILSANGRIGSDYNPNMIRNVNSYSCKVSEPGHSFLAYQIDYSRGPLERDNSFYIECTLNFKVTGKKSLIDMEIVELEKNVISNINTLFSTSQSIYDDYRDSMYNVPNDEIYTNVIDDYLKRIPDSDVDDWYVRWGDLFNRFIMTKHKIDHDTKLTKGVKLMLILDLLNTFPKVPSIWLNYKLDVLRILSTPELLSEDIETKTKYKDSTLVEFINRWNPSIEDSEDIIKKIYGDIIGLLNKVRLHFQI